MATVIDTVFLWPSLGAFNTVGMRVTQNSSATQENVSLQLKNKQTLPLAVYTKTKFSMFTYINGGWCDMTWHDIMWCDMIWHEMTWHGVVYDMMLYDMTWWCDMSWWGVAWHDVMWHGVTWWCDMSCEEWHGMMWCDMVWHGMTWICTWK